MRRWLGAGGAVAGVMCVQEALAVVCLGGARVGAAVRRCCSSSSSSSSSRGYDVKLLAGHRSISTTAAYAFARLKFARKQAVLNSMLLLQMFPVAVALVASATSPLLREWAHSKKVWALCQSSSCS